MKKNNQGFTLVELIVVIAILGILAGIAIPVYSGYISKAKEASDYAQLDAIKTATVFAAVDADADTTVSKITITVSSKKVAYATGVKVNDATDATNISAYFGTNTEYEFQSDKFSKASTITWTADSQKWN